MKNRPLLLILVCLALGVLVYLDNWHGASGAVPRRRPAHARAAQAAGADAEPRGCRRARQAPASAAAAARKTRWPPSTRQLLKDWVERPLFAPSRKRPAAVATAAAAVTQQVAAKLPPPTYDLLGIVRDGDRAIALLRKKGEGTSFRVEVGDMIGGWRVAKMEPASVVLEREDGTSQTVPLSRE